MGKDNMKYRALALTTAVAMTASLFAIPIHAEDTTINVTEVDLTGLVDSITEGDPASKLFTEKVAVKTDNDEKFTSTYSHEMSFEYNTNPFGVHAYAASNDLVLYDKNNVAMTKYETFNIANQYDVQVSYKLVPESGYTFAEYSPSTATTKITLKINGVDKTNSSSVRISKRSDGNGGTYYELSVYNGHLYSPVAKAETSTESPMYRLYNPNSGEHFYTSSADEREIDVAAGWNYEGVGWVAPTTGTPVMRLYNPVAGEHHYTTSKDEADNLVAAGWNLESDCAWYSAPAETGIPVYREYNPNQFAWNHNYTPNQEENDLLVKAGWQFEGISWYAVGL